MLTAGFYGAITGLTETLQIAADIWFALTIIYIAAPRRARALLDAAIRYVTTDTRPFDPLEQVQPPSGTGTPREIEARFNRIEENDKRASELWAELRARVGNDTAILYDLLADPPRK